MPPPLQKISTLVRELFLYDILRKKLSTPLGLCILISLSLFVALVCAKAGLTLGVAFFALICSTAFLVFVLLSPKLGLFTGLIIPFALFSVERYIGIDLPFGAAIQAILFLTAVAILFRKLVKKESGFQFLRSTTSVALLIFLAYNLLQGLNPNVNNLDGWFYTLRGMFSLICGYFIGSYYGSDKRFLNQFVSFWLILCTIAALYACYQEWFDLADFERNWINADRLRFNRIFVQGRYRKFSLLSDPTAFGMLMASSSLVAIILSLRSQKLIYRLLFIMASILMLTAMGYSGTRTAYAMLPAGLVLFALMTITNPRTLAISALGVMAFGFVLFGPIYGNATVNRIRSTFDSDDQSLNIRDINRNAIQPYIYEHPFGGGLMTTGDSGLKYNPDHPLAGFPPDNGYLKLVLEIGWFGLVGFVLFIYTGIREGIKTYYRNPSHPLKYHALAFTVFIFSIGIALYAQSVTAQVPMSLIFWPLMGIITQIKHIK
ncbi:MAG: O-antigen ligase family protein [Bacteroidota bacterium]